MIGTLTTPTSASIAPARSARAGSSIAPLQRDEAEVQEQQDQFRGEARVPDPPGAPGRLAPQRAGPQRDEGEQRAGGRERRGHHAREARVERQAEPGPAGHHQVEEHRHPGRRHVDEDDAVGLALLVRRSARRRRRHTGRRARARRLGPKTTGSVSRRAGKNACGAANRNRSECHQRLSIEGDPEGRAGSPRADERGYRKKRAEQRQVRRRIDPDQSWRSPRRRRTPAPARTAAAPAGRAARRRRARPASAPRRRRRAGSAPACR